MFIDKQKFDDFTYDECINACKLWVSIHGYRLPGSTRTMLYDNKIFHIGNFINSIKHGYYPTIKNEVELVFNKSIEFKKKMTEDDYIRLTQSWIDLYGKTLPLEKDTIMHKSRKINYYKFITSLKYNECSPDIKDKIEKIFGFKIDATKRKKCIRLTHAEWLDVCRLWVKSYGKILPTRGDKIIYKKNIIYIGLFINNLRKGHNFAIKQDVENILGQEIKLYDVAYSRILPQLDLNGN